VSPHNAPFSTYKAARVHHAARRRCGRLAARGARAAARDAGDRVHERALAGGFRASGRGVPSRPEGGRFVEGQNVAIEFRWARGQYDLLPAMAADLVSRGVSVLTTAGGDPAALAAKRATSTIPIVFGLGGDPVSAGLVQSVNQPGGNATGVTLLTTLMEPKRLGLLRDLVPGVPLVGVLLNPRFPTAPRQLREIEEAARTIDQRIIVANASDDAELEAAFGSLTSARVAALLVTANSYFDVRRNRIVGFAAQQRLPAIYQFREYAVAGGLLSYGVDI